MFDINKFKTSGLTKGGARSSLFEVEIDIPNTVISKTTVSEAVSSADPFELYTTTGNTYALNKNDIIDKFKYLCHVSSLPGTRSTSPIKLSYLGRNYNFAGDKTFSDFTTSIYNDEDFLIRNAIEIWLDRINDTFSLGKTTSPSLNDGGDEYKSNIKIFQYSKNGTLIKDYTLVNCFPNLISDIGLNFSSNNIEDFTITWTYDYFTTNMYKMNSLGTEKITVPQTII